MPDLPSQEYLQSRIDYNPETGEARWKPVDESYGYNWQRFNKQCADKPVPNRASIQGRVYAKDHLLHKLLTGSDSYRLANAIEKAKNSSSSKTYKAIDKSYRQLVMFDHVLGNLLWIPRGVKDWDARFANKLAGSVGRSGYSELKTKINGKYESFMVHRVAWFLYYDSDPINFQIDHIDGNRLNNSIKNLRLANNSFNQQAKRTKKIFSKRPDRDTFYCNININGKNIYLGDYKTEAEAQAAYEAALQKYKPIYQFTESEQAMLDELYNTYPNCDPALQHACHDLQVKALNHYIEAVQ